MDTVTTINNKKLIERDFDIQLKRKINNNIVLALDEIAQDYITSLNNPMLQDINAVIYKVVITAKQYNNDLKQISAEKRKLNQQPEWIMELKH